MKILNYAKHADLQTDLLTSFQWRIIKLQVYNEEDDGTNINCLKYILPVHTTQSFFSEWIY